jgi:hypothetical protein
MYRRHQISTREKICVRRATCRLAQRIKAASHRSIQQHRSLSQIYSSRNQLRVSGLDRLALLVLNQNLTSRISTTKEYNNGKTHLLLLYMDLINFASGPTTRARSTVTKRMN